MYQSERQGGLTVIDGHLRKGDYADQEWPCLMTDLDDAEADYMLLMHDELGRQAEREKAAVQALMARVHSGEAGVQALVGRMADELGILLQGVNGHGTRDDIPEPEIDRAEELREKWGTALGQIWQLGRHRVLCGDCTNTALVIQLMNTHTAVLCHADPPYGMGKEAEGIANDNLYGQKLDAFQMRWWTAVRSHLAANASVYVWGNAEDLWRLWFQQGLQSSERLTFRNELVWDKAVADENPTCWSPGCPWKGGACINRFRALSLFHAG